MQYLIHQESDSNCPNSSFVGLHGPIGNSLIVFKKTSYWDLPIISALHMILLSVEYITSLSPRKANFWANGTLIELAVWVCQMASPVSVSSCRFPLLKNLSFLAFRVSLECWWKTSSYDWIQNGDKEVLVLLSGDVKISLKS